MRMLPLVLGFVLLVSATASAQSFGVGGLLPFEQKCGSCHIKPEAGSRAPSREQLQGQPPETIYAAMTTGGMAPMAVGLTDAQMRAIAEYVSGRGFGTATAGDAALMKNQCAAKPLGNPLEGPAWNGWGVDKANTRFQPAAAAGLTAATVPKPDAEVGVRFSRGPAGIRPADGRRRTHLRRFRQRLRVRARRRHRLRLLVVPRQGQRAHRDHRGAGPGFLAVCGVLRRHQGERLCRRRRDRRPHLDEECRLASRRAHYRRAGLPRRPPLRAGLVD